MDQNKHSIVSKLCDFSFLNDKFCRLRVLNMDITIKVLLLTFSVLLNFFVAQGLTPIFIVTPWFVGFQFVLIVTIPGFCESSHIIPFFGNFSSSPSVPFIFAEIVILKKFVKESAASY